MKQVKCSHFKTGKKYYTVHRDVDVTTVTVTKSFQLLKSNSFFNTVGRNPFSVLEQRDVIDDGDDAASVGSDESTSSTDSFGLFGGDHHFANRYCSILDIEL